ncbi:MAG: hypothetical protein ACTSPE_13370 [Candidatus Thorarchaeota archaeon]
MFLVTPVAAATSQGLEWGVAYGDRFDFEMKSSDESVGEDIYLNITKMPTTAIPDPLDDWSNIPQPDIGFYWANGTSMGISVLIFIGLIAVGSKIVVPVGNFSLLTELVSVKLTGEDIIDEANIWGVSWSVDVNSTHEQRVVGTYSKVDGFLAEYKLETVLSTTDEVVDSLSVIRKNLPSAGGLDLSNITQLLKDNMLYVGAGIAVLVILAIVCKKK